MYIWRVDERDDLVVVFGSVQLGCAFFFCVGGSVESYAVI